VTDCVTLRAVYRERAQLLAYFATRPEHRAALTPAGQMTWHIHQDDHAWEWDGHSTDEKYRRLRTLTARTT
jgi:hypothetical protein